MFTDTVTQNISVRGDDDTCIFVVVIVVFIPWNYINMPKEKTIIVLLKDISKLFFFLLNKNMFLNIRVDLTNPPKF